MYIFKIYRLWLFIWCQSYPPSHKTKLLTTTYGKGFLVTSKQSVLIYLFFDCPVALCLLVSAFHRRSCPSCHYYARNVFAVSPYITTVLQLDEGKLWHMVRLLVLFLLPSLLFCSLGVSPPSQQGKEGRRVEHWEVNRQVKRSVSKQSGTLFKNREQVAA